jgi:hypothetical protein
VKCFEAKQRLQKQNEVIRKIMKQSEQKNMEAKKEAKRKIQKRKEKYRSEKKKIGKRKEAKKCMQNFRLNMQNGSETNPVLLCFALKRKKLEAKPAHPMCMNSRTNPHPLREGADKPFPVHKRLYNPSP